MSDIDQIADRVRAIRPHIKDNFSLCEFMGKTEREYLVAETICAACLNLEAHGGPFSFRGDGVFTCTGGGLFDNHSAYRYLVDYGFFREETTPAGKAVIYPTEKLLDKLERFFGVGAAGATP